MKNFLERNSLHQILSMIKSEIQGKEGVGVMVEYNNNNGIFNIWNGDPEDMLIAPLGEESKWFYILEGDNIILNGPKEIYENHIAYDRYIIDGKKYKTKIKYIDNTANSKLKSIKYGNYIDFSEFQGGNNSLKNMFNLCRNLVSIDFGKGFNTVINSYNNLSDTDGIAWMFYTCNNLKEIKGLEYWDISKFTKLDYLFANCRYITDETISRIKSWDISNIRSMIGMFQGCSFLTSLDFTSFDTHNVTDMTLMFCGCTNLKEIKVSRSKWVIRADCNTSNMFLDCGVDHVTYVD